MSKNVGGIDRIIRVVIGLALIAWALMGTSSAAVWGWVGIVPLVTGLIGWCPPYAILGMSSCKTKST